MSDKLMYPGRIKPRVGQTWEVKLSGKRRIVKTIGRIYRVYFYDPKGSRRFPYVHWKRLNKGRYSGIRVKTLLKFGKLICK